MTFDSRYHICILSILSISPLALADHGPGTSGGGVTTQSAEVLKPCHWALSLQNDWTNFDVPSLEGKDEFDFIDNAYLTTLSVAVGLAENFQASFSYGYYAAEGAGELEDGEKLTFDPDGFTDLWINAKYRVYRGPAGQFAIYVGIKAPVGETDVYNAEGERVEPPSMPGSGAWDSQLGVAYTYALGPTLSLDASGQYIFRGEHFDYRIGDRIDAGVALGWRVCGEAKGRNVSLMAEALLRSLGKGESDGERLDNTGGTTLLFAPGVRIGLCENSALSISAQLPLVQDLNGDQVESRFRLTSALTVSF